MRMKLKECVIIIGFAIILTGCEKGTIEDIQLNVESELIEDTGSQAETDLSENTEIESDKEIGVETEKQVEEKTHPFVISLPEGVTIGENVDGMEAFSAWKINVEEYDALNIYPYGDESDLWMSAGWIDVYNGEYSYDGNNNPYIPWNHFSFYNYQNCDTSILCEVECEVYSNNVYVENDIEYEDGIAYFWCVIFERPLNSSDVAPALKESNWIFLSKKCFTREQAVSIAENYEPTWNSK